MQINFFPKIIFLFISIVLLSPMLHAEVKVLCLGEGECVSLENYVHPGSLSGASEAEQAEYEVWKVEQEKQKECKTDVLSYDSCEGFHKEVGNLEDEARTLLENSTSLVKDFDDAYDSFNFVGAQEAANALDEAASKAEIIAERGRDASLKDLDGIASDLRQKADDASVRVVALEESRDSCEEASLSDAILDLLSKPECENLFSKEYEDAKIEYAERQCQDSLEQVLNQSDPMITARPGIPSVRLSEVTREIERLSSLIEVGSYDEVWNMFNWRDKFANLGYKSDACAYGRVNFKNSPNSRYEKGEGWCSWPDGLSTELGFRQALQLETKWNRVESGGSSDEFEITREYYEEVDKAIAICNGLPELSAVEDWDGEVIACEESMASEAAESKAVCLDNVEKAMTKYEYLTSEESGSNIAAYKDWPTKFEDSKLFQLNLIWAQSGYYPWGNSCAIPGPRAGVKPDAHLTTGCRMRLGWDYFSHMPDWTPRDYQCGNEYTRNSDGTHSQGQKGTNVCRSGGGMANTLHGKSWEDPKFVAAWD